VGWRMPASRPQKLIGTENLRLSSRAAATGRETSGDALRGILLLNVDKQPALASLGLSSLKSR
jgi:hypothetical protein